MQPSWVLWVAMCQHKSSKELPVVGLGSDGNIRKNIMNTFIVWHKKYVEWWKQKLSVSDYAIAWISFIKGLIIGLLIYHFFIN